MRKTLHILSLLTLALLSNPLSSAVVSAKAMGMGNVGVAYPQDGFAAAFNPAAINFVGRRMDVELSYEASNGRCEITQATVSEPYAPTVTTGQFSSSRAHHWCFPSVGISGHFCDDCSLSWGVVAYTKEKINTGYRNAFPLYGTSRAGLQLIQEMISTTFACRYYCHHLAISANFCLERFYASGLERFDSIIGDANNLQQITVSRGNVTNRSPDYATGWSFTVGWIGQLLPSVTLGLVYESRAKMTRMKNYQGLLAEGGRINFPERYSAGFSGRICKCTYMTMDIHYVNWSDVDSMNNSNPRAISNLLNHRFGAQDGAGFGWTSQTLYRVGLEHRCTDYDLRCGFQYGKPPVKPSQTAINKLTLEVVQTLLTCGFSYRPNPSDEMSFYYAYGVRNKIHGSPTDPDWGDEKNNLINTYHRIGFSYGRHW